MLVFVEYIRESTKKRHNLVKFDAAYFWSLLCMNRFLTIFVVRSVLNIDAPIAYITGEIEPEHAPILHWPSSKPIIQRLKSH